MCKFYLFYPKNIFEGVSMLHNIYTCMLVHAHNLQGHTGTRLSAYWEAYVQHFLLMELATKTPVSTALRCRGFLKKLKASIQIRCSSEVSHAGYTENNN